MSAEMYRVSGFGVGADGAMVGTDHAFANAASETFPGTLSNGSFTFDLKKAFVRPHFYGGALLEFTAGANLTLATGTLVVTMLANVEQGADADTDESTDSVDFECYGPNAALLYRPSVEGRNGARVFYPLFRGLEIYYNGTAFAKRDAPLTLVATCANAVSCTLTLLGVDEQHVLQRVIDARGAGQRVVSSARQELVRPSYFDKVRRALSE